MQFVLRVIYLICSCRLAVRTLPFHGGNVRAIRARSDMFPSFNWVGCPLRFLRAMRVRVLLGNSLLLRKEIMNIADTLLQISSVVICILFIIDIKYTLEKIKKMDKLMRLVRRGEVSYIQFVNEVLSGIIAE